MVLFELVEVIFKHYKINYFNNYAQLRYIILRVFITG